MILILTDKFDAHADKVISHLEKKNINYFRFNLDVQSLLKTHISMNEDGWYITQNQNSFNSNMINCVWLRRPFVELTLEEMDNQTSDFKIWKNEWNKTLNGLYLDLKNKPWLNPIRKAYKAENKYLQSKIAKEIGLEMPPYIVSNIKSDLLDFADIHAKVVLKLMSQDFYRSSNGTYEGIYVNVVSKAELDEFNEFQENPIILQKYIDKSYEVRYTVVGNNHFVCKIDSQASKKAAIDWRRYDIPNTPHYEMEPPGSIKQKVNKLLDDLELSYGALDFIVTPANKWYFLEINCLGQWLWIEDLTAMPISKAICDWLISHNQH